MVEELSQIFDQGPNISCQTLKRVHQTNKIVTLRPKSVDKNLVRLANGMVTLPEQTILSLFSVLLYYNFCLALQ